MFSIVVHNVYDMFCDSSNNGHLDPNFLTGETFSMVIFRKSITFVQDVPMATVSPHSPWFVDIHSLSIQTLSWECTQASESYSNTSSGSAFWFIKTSYLHHIPINIYVSHWKYSMTSHHIQIFPSKIRKHSHQMSTVHHHILVGALNPS